MYNLWTACILFAIWWLSQQYSAKTPDVLHFPTRWSDENQGAAATQQFKFWITTKRSLRIHLDPCLGHFFCFWRLKMNRTRKIKTKHLDPIGLWQVFFTGLCRILGWYPKECLINHHIPVFHIGIIFKRPLFGGVPLLVPSFFATFPFTDHWLIFDSHFFLREGPRIGLRINVQVSPPWFLAIFPQPNPVKVCVYNSI